MIDSYADSDWIIDEFRHASFSDERLFNRFILTAKLLASRPLDNVNKACGSWPEAKGAYRLFGNSNFESDEVFLSHQIETSKRINPYKLVFALQDTTYLDFHRCGKTKGLGSISKTDGVYDRFGLILHPSLIVTESGIPLGLLSLNCWSRPVSKTGRSKQEKDSVYKQKVLCEKESYKWPLAMKETSECIKLGTRVIAIGDRESDMYAFMDECLKLNHGFVIRSKSNRNIKSVDDVSFSKLFDHLSSMHPSSVVGIEIPESRGIPSRIAQVEIRFNKYTTPRNKNQKGGSKFLSKEIEFYAIKLSEIEPPIGVEAINWTLLTSEPITNIDEALEKVRWYRLRWQIEVFFKILKSGCKVESSRLGTSDRLIKYITIQSVIAWRIFFLQHMAMQHPEKSCEEVLSKHHWQALYCRVNKTSQLPDTPPSINEAVRWIAKLGGFLDRKSDGHPGPTVLWRGWQVLEEIVYMWKILQPP